MLVRLLVLLTVSAAAVSAAAARGGTRIRAKVTEPVYDRQEEVQKTLRGSRTAREKEAILLPLRQMAGGRAPEALDPELGPEMKAYRNVERDMIEEYLRKVADRIRTETWKDVLPLLDRYFERRVDFESTELSEVWLEWKTAGEPVAEKAKFCAERWFGIVDAKGIDHSVFHDALSSMDDESVREPFEKAFARVEGAIRNDAHAGVAAASADLMAKNQFFTPEREALDRLARDKSEFRRFVGLLLMIRLGRDDETVQDLFSHFLIDHPPLDDKEEPLARLYKHMIPKVSVPLMRKPALVKRLLSALDALGESPAAGDARGRIYRMLQTGPEVEGIRPLVEAYLAADKDAASVKAARALLRAWKRR